MCFDQGQPCDSFQSLQFGITCPGSKALHGQRTGLWYGMFDMSTLFLGVQTML